MYSLIFVAGIILMSVCMAQNVYVRTCVRDKPRSLGFADYFLWFAFICSVACQAVIYAEWRRGVIGVHASEKSKEEDIVSTALTFTSFILYTVCTCCTRISACCLYRQIFIVSHQRKITQCVISATGIGYAIAIILISFFTWVPDSPVRKAIYPLTASASMISNVAFCCLPVWWIWKQEKMSKRKKLVLTVVTTWGIVTTCFPLYGVVQHLSGINSDPIWAIGEMSIWIMIDASFSVITCSLLNIRQFFRHMRRQAVSRNTYSNGVETPQHYQDLKSHDYDAKSHKTTSTNATQESLSVSSIGDCDAESHKTTCTNAAQKSLSVANTRVCDVEKKDRLLSWDMIPKDSQDAKTGTTRRSWVVREEDPRT